MRKGVGQARWTPNWCWWHFARGDAEVVDIISPESQEQTHAALLILRGSRSDETLAVAADDPDPVRRFLGDVRHHPPARDRPAHEHGGVATGQGGTVLRGPGGGHRATVRGNLSTGEIAFGDTRNALSIGLVDCAITSVASASFAGWLDYSRYYFPLAVHFGLNGYAISLKKWRQLSAKEQEILQGTFDAYLDDLWRFSEETHQDASDCIIGRPCRNGTPYQLTLVEPSPEDARIFKETAQTHVLPEWAEKCEQVHPGCRQEWEAKVFTQVP